MGYENLLVELRAPVGRITLNRPAALNARSLELRDERLFQATFATEDRKEGVSAFVDMRKPRFRNRWCRAGRARW